MGEHQLSEILVYRLARIYVNYLKSYVFKGQSLQMRAKLSFGNDRHEGRLYLCDLVSCRAGEAVSVAVRARFRIGNTARTHDNAFRAILLTVRDNSASPSALDHHRFCLFVYYTNSCIKTRSLKSGYYILRFVRNRKDALSPLGLERNTALLEKILSICGRQT